MTFFEAAPSLNTGALIARGHWWGNAIGFGPRGQLCYFWTPSAKENQKAIRDGNERWLSGPYTLTKDDMTATDWQVIKEESEK